MLRQTVATSRGDSAAQALIERERSEDVEVGGERMGSAGVACAIIESRKTALHIVLLGTLHLLTVKERGRVAIVAFIEPPHCHIAHKGDNRQP